MTRLVVRMGALIVAFAGLLVLVRIVGRTATNPLAAVFTERTRPDGQTQVCWHDICPGLTSVAEAREILKSDPTLKSLSVRDYPSCWVARTTSYLICLDSEGNSLVNIAISRYVQYPEQTEVFGDPPTFQLGDLLALWGHPIANTNPHCGTSNLLFSNNGMVQVGWLVRPDLGNRWSLDPRLSWVGAFSLSIPGNVDRYLAPVRWSGFLTTARLPCLDD